MNPHTFRDLVLSPVLSDLGSRDPRLDTAEATVMLAAIAFQETNLRYRRQMPQGPARGLWQFEISGVGGALLHMPNAGRALMTDLGYGDAVTIGDTAWLASDVHKLLEFNDQVACILARALLWSDPAPIPAVDDEQKAYAYYDRLWRPGKKRPEAWASSHSRARALVLDVHDVGPTLA